MTRNTLWAAGIVGLVGVTAGAVSCLDAVTRCDVPTPGCAGVVDTTTTSGTGSGGSSSTSSSSTSSSGGGGASSSSSSSTSTSSSSGGMCADTSSDPMNCGACGHLCGGPAATCAGGVCAPVVLGGPFGDVTAITARSTLVGAYWATHDLAVANSALGGVDQVGMAVVAGNSPNLIGGLALAVDGSRVFAASSSSLYEWVPGTMLKVIFQPQTATLTGSLAASATFIAAGALGTSSNLQTLMVDPNGGLSSFVSNDTSPHLTADDASIYSQASSQELFRVEPSGLLDFETANPPLSLDALAADADPSAMGFLYGISASKLLRVPKVFSGTPPAMEIASVLNAQAQGLAVSAAGGDVYWLVDGGNCGAPVGQLWRLNWGSGTPTILVDKLACPRNLALDKHSLYYSAGPPGAVRIFRVEN